MKTDNKQKLFKLLSEILNIPIEEISVETSPKNTNSWDSFNGLMIAAELEKQFCLSFNIEEVISITNVGDIIKALQKHGIVI